MTDKEDYYLSETEIKSILSKPVPEISKIKVDMESEEYICTLELSLN